MSTGRGIQVVALRATATLLLFLGLFFLPWWVLVLLGIFSTFFIPWFLELVFLGYLFDFFYSAESISLFALGALGAILIIEWIRPRLFLR